MRARFTAGCLRLPLAMFEEVQPAVPGWPNSPGAVLRLSEAYDESAAQARALGRPVVEPARHHLVLLTGAESIVGPLLGLAYQLRRQQLACLPRQFEADPIDLVRRRARASSRLRLVASTSTSTNGPTRRPLRSR